MQESVVLEMALFATVFVATREGMVPQTIGTNSNLPDEGPPILNGQSVELETLKEPMIFTAHRANQRVIRGN